MTDGNNSGADDGSRLLALVKLFLAEGAVPAPLLHSVLTMVAMRPAALDRLRRVLSPAKYGKLLEWLWEYGLDRWGDEELVRVGPPLALWHLANRRADRARAVWAPVEELLLRAGSAGSRASRLRSGRTAARLLRSVLGHVGLWAGEPAVTTGASGKTTHALGIVASIAGPDSLSAALFKEAISRRCFPRDPKAAVRAARQALSIRERLLPAGSWLVWRTRRRLGALLAGIRRRADARRHLERCEKEHPADPVTLGWLLKLESGRRPPPAFPGALPAPFGVLRRAVASRAWFCGEGRAVPLPARVALLGFLWDRRERLGDDAWRLTLGLEHAFDLAAAGLRRKETAVWEGISGLQAGWGVPGRHVQADNLVSIMHESLGDLASAWWKAVRRTPGSGLSLVRERLAPFESAGRLSDQYLAFLEEPRDPGLPGDFPRVAAALPVARDLVLRAPAAKRVEVHRVLTVLAAVEARAGSDHPCTASALNRLAILLLRGGAPENALAPARAALKIREEEFGPANDLVALLTSNLAAVELALCHYDVAEDLLHRATGISPGRPLAYYWFARLYQARSAPGDRSREIRYWHEFLRLETGREPRIAEAHQRLNELEGGRGSG